MKQDCVILLSVRLFLFLANESGPTSSWRPPCPYLSLDQEGWVLSTNRWQTKFWLNQEDSLINASTSEVFWCSSDTSDQRQFPGSAKKTLHGQSVESILAPGDTDIRWRGSRRIRPSPVAWCQTPQHWPRMRHHPSLTAGVDQQLNHLMSSKKNPKQDQKLYLGSLSYVYMWYLFFCIYLFRWNIYTEISSIS